MAAKVRDKVIAELDAAGVDGQAAYEMMREEMANASQ